MSSRSRALGLALALALAASGCVEDIAVIVARASADAASTDATRIDGGPLPVPSTRRRLAAGQWHACAIVDPGALYCWGQNVDGQTGQPPVETQPRPMTVGTDADWQQIALGESFSCGVRADRNLYCFGRNDHGQLGQGDLASRSVPVQVPLPGPVRAIDVGYSSTCAALEDGRLFCWGLNSEGQLGLEHADDVHVPTPVPVASGWRHLALGRGASLAIDDEGELWGTGGNARGALGLGEGSPVQRWTFTLISAAGWSSSDHEHAHSCALDLGGSVHCFGLNTSAQLGTGDRIERWSPTRVEGPSAAYAISVSAFHSCALAGAGTLWCWGRNAEGQLGTSDTEDRSRPVTVAPIADGWIEIAAGRFFTCASRADQTVWCTGGNFAGELGIGVVTERRSTLTQIEPADLGLAPR